MDGGRDLNIAPPINKYSLTPPTGPGIPVEEQADNNGPQNYEAQPWHFVLIQEVENLQHSDL